MLKIIGGPDFGYALYTVFSSMSITNNVLVDRSDHTIEKCMYESALEDLMSQIDYICLKFTNKFIFFEKPISLLHEYKEISTHKNSLENTLSLLDSARRIVSSDEEVECFLLQCQDIFYASKFIKLCKGGVELGFEDIRKNLQDKKYDSDKAKIILYFIWNELFSSTDGNCL